MKRKKRIFLSLAGILLTGVSVAILRKVVLGVDPFSCLIQAVENRTGLDYCIVFPVITACLLGITFLISKHLIGIGTLINLLGFGFMVDGAGKIFDFLWQEINMQERMIGLVIAFVLMCFSAALYFTADLGVSAYDAVALILEEKRVASFFICRIAADLICVTVGLLGGADVGPATVLTAFCMGPLTAFFQKKIAYPFLHGRTVSQTKLV